MKITKHLVVLFLCFSLFTMFCITAFAAGGETNLYAEVDSNMPIPQMIGTSTSWLNRTNPEHFTSFYTMA